HGNYGFLRCPASTLSCGLGRRLDVGGGAVEFAAGGFCGVCRFFGSAQLGVEIIGPLLRCGDTAAEFSDRGLFSLDLGGGFFEFGRRFAAFAFQMSGRDRLATAAASRLSSEILERLEPPLGSLQRAVRGTGAC